MGQFVYYPEEITLTIGPSIPTTAGEKRGAQVIEDFKKDAAITYDWEGDFIKVETTLKGKALITQLPVKNGHLTISIPAFSKENTFLTDLFKEERSSPPKIIGFSLSLVYNNLVPAHQSTPEIISPFVKTEKSGPLKFEEGTPYMEYKFFLTDVDYSYS